MPNGTAFSLKWSPWVSSGNSLSASLAIISNNYVGFRKIVIQRDCEKAQEPNVEVDDSDTTGICLFLSADSLVEWEDTVCRTFCLGKLR